RFRPTPLFVEMEQARVVPLVRALEQFAQSLVHLAAVKQCVQLLIRLSPSILADTEEDDSVEDCLDREIQLSKRQASVAQSEVLRENVAPRLDLPQEYLVDLRRALLGDCLIGVLVEQTLEHFITCKHTRQTVPRVGVLLIGEVVQPSGSDIVLRWRTRAAAVAATLLE